MCAASTHASVVVPVRAAQYMQADNADGDLDAAFAAVAAQFAMPTVKSADAAASGGGARGV